MNSPSRYSLLFFCFCISLTALCQSTSKYIVVDQFGYLPSSKKIAVVRNPETGFDASESFTPGSSYAVIDAKTGQAVLTGTAVSWNAGALDNSSGDRVWWFDFSAVTSPGSYYILDVDKNVRSYGFDISPTIYNSVLRHAMRSFFYQRVGYAKEARYAGIGWADGASHLGPLQDKNARPYNEKTNASKEMDLSGAWYDAGDFNRYTNWTAGYVVDFLRSYLEAPGIWTDDYNIPESGNGIPDLLDEVKWGIDHLLRLQQQDGGVVSIIGCAHASPPSAATGQSVYGTASTSATLNTAAAYAFASKVFGERGLTDYALQLKTSAIKAWDWGVANPNVLFKNNDAASGTSGVGAGQQETDDYGRFIAKLKAACFLYEITLDQKYKDFIEANYTKVHLIEWGWNSLYEASNNEVLLYYTTLPNINATVADKIITTYKNTLNTNDHFLAHQNHTDPYLAYINTYGWGSNSMKSLQGLIFTDLINYNVDLPRNQEAREAAETYIHYIHGVNPLNVVYLSNMYDYGAENCVNEFYHSWFANGSAKWDRVGTSVYGPAPGFLTGGPNPSYNWDGVCPGNAGCNTESITPPKGQPAQKSYKDFNTSWPLNSWEVTENSNGYQINYIRLLSKFIQAGLDCHGTANGTASFDVCGHCSGGETGITPSTTIEACKDNVLSAEEPVSQNFKLYPNPATSQVIVEPKLKSTYTLEVFNAQGKMIFTTVTSGKTTISLADQRAGVYLFKINQGGVQHVQKILK